MEGGNSISIPNQKGQPVAELSLPDGWAKGKKPPRPGYLFVSKFILSDRDQRVGVTIREPAKKTYHFMEPQQNLFLQLLRRPAHELSETEIQSVHLLLDQVAWPAKFKRDWARTVFFSPHNVLSIQGTWITERIRSRAIIMDTTFDTGNFVQELWYVAPPEVFDLYAAEAERIFSSFRWVTADQPVMGFPRASG